MMAAKSMKKQEAVEQSSSKRHFHWTTKVSNNEDEAIHHDQDITKEKNDESHSPPPSTEKKEIDKEKTSKKLHLHAVAVSRMLRSLFGKSSHQRVLLGTLFGNKRGGHLHFAFQKDAKSQPTLLIQLTTPITGLVREMGEGSVRIALESEKKNGEEKPLLEERVWKTYCNGIKSGTATRIECGAKEWKILKAVEPISMGAGVLPAAGEDNDGGGDDDDEMVYMRAKFERVVGNADSEALYMVNPDNNVNGVVAPPELSIYLLRL